METLMDVPRETEGVTTRKILIVDDEDPIRFAMSEYFRPQGYEVDCAQEKEEAEALLVHKCYSAAILDLCLSGTDGTEGLELVRFIRERCPGTKVVVLTAYGSAEIVAEASKRGVDAFLHKPMPLFEVEKIVSELVETSS
jgi:DNA-binding NtrC family response regulator